MSDRTLRFVVKPAVFLASLGPLGWLVWAALTGNLSVNPLSDLTNETGVWALRFVCMTLALTPLRRITGWNAAIKFRRMTGLFAFFYGTLHFLTYVIADRFAGLDFPDGIVAVSTLRNLAKSVGEDIYKRPFITVGFTTWLSMLPLALTSTAGSIRRLGGKRWNRLHRLVYFTGVAAVLHYWWLVKADIQRPVAYGIVVAILLGFRVYWKRAHSRPKAVVAAAAIVATLIGFADRIAAQEPEPTTREAAIEKEQAEKAKVVHPYAPGKLEGLLNRADDILNNGVPRWHPFLESAYYGGGLTIGAGYAHHVSPYNLLDVRGSYTILGYKRIEAELTAPRMFQRRGSLTLLGGWREATQAAFYGVGMETELRDRSDFDFRQPYGSALMTLWPTRRLLMLRGGLELSQWSLRPSEGDIRSVETVYTPTTLPGLGTKTTYVHAQGTVGLDWRTSPGYSRRGGYYGVSLHDYADQDERFGFRQIDYEAIQHIPILREAWVISLRAIARTTEAKTGQQVPFFLLPYVGSGSTLRAYTSHRFRDQNGLTLQAEWRIMVNRFMDTAVFYDAGKVAARRGDLDLNGLKSDYGFGFRLHGPFSTPLRIELARSPEGLRLIFAGDSIF